MTLVFFIGGLVLLVAGAELLVRGASNLAIAFGIAPLIIGLTVVAFGTSAPEFAVGISSSLNGQPDIAIGNAIGSNIFNVLFILGLAAVITPLAVSRQLIRLDVPFMIAVSVITFVIALDGRISQVEGAMLFAGLVFYTGFLVYLGRKEGGGDGPAETAITRSKFSSSWQFNSILLVVGLGMLVLGSNWLVKSAVTIAQYFEISESVIGLTIVAGGTSLPEVVTSIVASIKGQRDMAVGNVVGSNIFNLLGVLGMSAFVSPTGLEVLSSVIHFDFPVMLVAALVCLPIFFTGGEIARWEGFFLFGFYLAYTGYLVLAASQHDAIDIYSAAMLYFVIPLAALTLFVSAWNGIKAKRASHRSN